MTCQYVLFMREPTAQDRYSIPISTHASLKVVHVDFLGATVYSDCNH